mmetsp:Transcript_21272/g.72050  ORF Transcript_21272/g.72050 Transcript_21272/m.72050 type:complete len:223 (-) Transcript_21272:19-687(-)
MTKAPRPLRCWKRALESSSTRGTRKASVLPEPVLALPRTSRPSSMGAMDRSWIFVMFSKPISFKASCVLSVSGSESKRVPENILRAVSWIDALEPVLSAAVTTGAATATSRSSASTAPSSAASASSASSSASSSSSSSPRSSKSSAISACDAAASSASSASSGSARAACFFCCCFFFFSAARDWPPTSAAAAFSSTGLRFSRSFFFDFIGPFDEGFTMAPPF